MFSNTDELYSININYNASSWLFTFVLQLVCNFGLVFILYATLLKKNPLKDLAITTNVNPWIILLAIPLGIFFYLLTIGVATVWQSGLSILGYTYPVTIDTIYSGPEVLALEIITFHGAVNGVISQFWSNTNLHHELFCISSEKSG